MKVFDENKPLSDAQLKRGLSDAVEVIERYGDQYWPIFDRLEEELKLRDSKLDRLKRLKRRSKFQ